MEKAFCQPKCSWQSFSNGQFCFGTETNWIKAILKWAYWENIGHKSLLCVIVETNLKGIPLKLQIHSAIINWCTLSSTTLASKICNFHKNFLGCKHLNFCGEVHPWMLYLCARFHFLGKKLRSMLFIEVFSFRNSTEKVASTRFFLLLCQMEHEQFCLQWLGPFTICSVKREQKTTNAEGKYNGGMCA